MYTLAEAAQIADLGLHTLRVWLGRGVLELTDHDQPAPQGGVRRLSAATTLAVCIAAQLARLSAPVERAIYAGMTFAHTASGNPRRVKPGALYGAKTKTLLALGLDEVSIFPISAELNALEILAMIGDGATVVVIDPIVSRFELRAMRADMRQRRER